MKNLTLIDKKPTQVILEITSPNTEPVVCKTIYHKSQELYYHQQFSSHPNVVNLLFGKTFKCYPILKGKFTSFSVLLLERMDGTCNDLIQEMKREGFDEKIKTLITIVKNTLDTIHFHGCIHGDVRLRNLFFKVDHLQQKILIKLGDFGKTNRIRPSYRSELQPLINEITKLAKPRGTHRSKQNINPSLKDNRWKSYSIS